MWLSLNGFPRGVTSSLDGHWRTLEPFQARLQYWDDDGCAQVRDDELGIVIHGRLRANHENGHVMGAFFDWLLWRDLAQATEPIQRRSSSPPR